MEHADPSPHQLDTLRLYGALVELREDWGGGLVLCCGAGCASSGIPAAVSIAGGATLAIDADATAVKTAMRAGELDFVVNTLDEALRALKNEIRQHRPLSVGLIADVDATLHEMAERGVLPELLLIGSGQSAGAILGNQSIQALQEAGMIVKRAAPEAAVPLSLTSSGAGYAETYVAAATAAGLRALDDRIQAILPLDDSIRRRWLKRASTYLRDACTGGRWIWLSEKESRALSHS